MSLVKDNFIEDLAVCRISPEKTSYFSSAFLRVMIKRIICGGGTSETGDLWIFIRTYHVYSPFFLGVGVRD